jgi:hypothetical protein
MDRELKREVRQLAHESSPAQDRFNHILENILLWKMLIDYQSRQNNKRNHIVINQLQEPHAVPVSTHGILSERRHHPFNS